MPRRGAKVPFGNTRPGIEAQVFGLAERGELGDDAFDPTKGTGYVEPRNGDYTFALSKDCDVQCLLFETFGGFSPAVVRLLARAADEVGNKLSRSQHLDEATWSTRKWTSLQCQKISIALHIACAAEIADELSCSGVRIARLGDFVTEACATA